MRRWELVRTGLRDTNDIMTLEHRWNGVFLNGSWEIVAHQLNVFKHDRMKTSISKIRNGLDSGWSFLLNLNLVDSVDVSRSLPQVKGRRFVE